EDLELALHLEAVRMRDILGSEDLWKKERGAIEQEVSRDLSNPEYLFYEKTLASLFHGSVYAWSPLGTKPSFDKTTAAALHAFHPHYYTPNNAILVIAGAIDPDAAIAKAKALFSDIPSRPTPARPKVQLGPVSATTLQLKSDRPYGLVAISVRFP